MSTQEWGPEENGTGYNNQCTITAVYNKTDPDQNKRAGFALPIHSPQRALHVAMEGQAARHVHRINLWRCVEGRARGMAMWETHSCHWWQLPGAAVAPSHCTLAGIRCRQPMPLRASRPVWGSGQWRGCRVRCRACA